MAKEIEYIDINLLHPHPDNPRKELGDLKELADSIKVKGVLQNLTVVKADDGYKVIIGHRRCAAAKIAGLTELPCIVTEMSDKEQLETMLLENIQRSDLTIKEQADGFQLMFDMGDNIDTISEKTGFSKTTIRKRLDIAKLDSAKVAAACGRQVTLGDFDKLAEIDDVDKRNELLDKMGTSNFNFALEDVLRRQNNEKNAEEWRKLLTKCKYKFKEIKESEPIGNYKYISYYSCAPDLQMVKKDVKAKGIAIDSQQLFFRIRITHYLNVEIYEEKPKKTAEEIEQERAERSERQTMDDKRAKIAAIAETACECRRKAIIECSPKKAKEAHDAIVRILIEINFSENYLHLNEQEFLKICKIKFKKPESTYREVPFDEVKDDISKEDASKLLLVYTYSMLNDNVRASCYNYACEYAENKRLSNTYRLLEAIGYEKSDEEIRFLEGRALE